MGSITSANAIITLWQPILFPDPVRLQGFSADDIFDIDGVAVTETSMGVDGVLSGGFVWTPRVQGITLQADSASNDFFDALNLQQEAASDVYALNGIVILSSIGRKWVMQNGYMTNYKPVPPGKRTLQPRTYQITWNRATVAPA